MTADTNALTVVAAFPDEGSLTRAREELGFEIAGRDTYTPSPPSDDPEGSRVRPVMAAGFVAGVGAATLVQAWSAGFAYPFNSGGRPLLSWPAFVPIAFEVGVLFAALAGVIALVVEAGLGRLHRPIFDAALSAAATDTSFLLMVGSTETRAPDLRARLGAAGAHSFEELRT